MKTYRVTIKYAKTSSAYRPHHEVVYRIEATNSYYARKDAKANFHEAHPKWVVHRCEAEAVPEQGPIWGPMPSLGIGDAIVVPRPDLHATIRSITQTHVCAVDDRGQLYKIAIEKVEAAMNRKVAREVVEYLILYPNGSVHTKEYGPVKSSSYDLDTELIQLRVTKVDGKIVRKEFVR